MSKSDYIVVVITVLFVSLVIFYFYSKSNNNEQGATAPATAISKSIDDNESKTLWATSDYELSWSKTVLQNFSRDTVSIWDLLVQRYTITFNWKVIKDDSYDNTVIEIDRDNRELLLKDQWGDSKSESDFLLNYTGDTKYRWYIWNKQYQEEHSKR